MAYHKDIYQKILTKKCILKRKVKRWDKRRYSGKSADLQATFEVAWCKIWIWLHYYPSKLSIVHFIPKVASIIHQPNNPPLPLLQHHLLMPSLASGRRAKNTFPIQEVVLVLLTLAPAVLVANAVLSPPAIYCGSIAISLKKVAHSWPFYLYLSFHNQFIKQTSKDNSNFFF